MRTRVWIPRTHVNAGWEWQPTDNPTARKAETGYPQDKLAEETDTIGKIWGINPAVQTRGEAI